MKPVPGWSSLAGKIAVAGKGGVGKTSVSAGLARLLSARGAAVYAVDADPDVSLGLALGVPEGVLDGLPPVMEAKELLAERTGGGALLVLNPAVDDLLASYSIDHQGIRLFRMGGIKGGGTACYCPENAVLRALLSSVVLRQGEVVLLDMGAGIEHLTRGTARGVDLMLVVSEPGKASIETALTIGRLSQDIGVRRVRYLGNKVRNSRDRQLLVEGFGDRLLGCLGVYEEVLDAAAAGGRVPLEGGFGRDLGELLDDVLSIIAGSELPLKKR